MGESSLKELTTVTYWDDRYEAGRNGVQDEESYEWFRTFEQLRPFLESNLPAVSASPKILHLGCGTSSLTADLFNLGYQRQCSVDFSPIAIEAMKTQYRDLGPGLEWRVMDVRKLDLETQSFDVAIDKGTLDAMLYGSPWDPEPEVKDNVGAYVDEVARTLKPGGKWLYITYGQKHFLKPLLSREKVWEMKIETLQDAAGSLGYVGFVMTKFS